MKLALSFVVYGLIGAILGWGIYLAIGGHYWVLAFSFIFYLILFAGLAAFITELATCLVCGSEPRAPPSHP